MDLPGGSSGRAPLPFDVRRSAGSGFVWDTEGHIVTNHHVVEGADIDYEGVSGPLDLDEVGDPTWGRYIIAQYQGGELVPIDSQDVDVTTLG